MASAKIKLDHGGMEDLLNSSAVGSMLEDKMGSALAYAIANAPVVTGNYLNGLALQVDHTDRIVCRLVATAPHSHLVEADTGLLARALGQVG